ncbi:unnamed protein product [Durusdinium trenchii]|uniref:Protein kinase domain-containing protein n=1 Tax=Durusdinium trenchii TaxID=1381693 RepID=A0ABP0LAY3_9DINO
MGAQFCSPGDEAVLQLVASSDIDGLAKLNLKSSGTYNASLPVAQVDLDARNFQPMSAFNEHFEAQEPTLQDPFALLVRHSSGSVQRLQKCRKPVGKDCQDMLRAHVARLQAQSSEGIARIVEVYEDSRSISLVLEHCNGGTLQDRILQRHFFAEQESAMLVRHMLETVQALHRVGLYHGHLTPDCFRFHSDQAHAPLKLVDFGLELKACLCERSPDSGHEQILAPSKATARDWPRSSSPHLFEACKVVFCAPEVFQHMKAETEGAPADFTSSWIQSGTEKDMLDLQLLSQAIDVHLEQNQDLGMDFLIQADIWSVGAIAFLLLCGYPPFFAPCRSAIISRVEKIEFSFDPPFWSKISEEAKDFVQRCLRGAPSQRLNVEEALQHPWIHKLADTAPSGPMLPSFALNLRRFYRTSIIEVLVARSLAKHLSYKASLELQLECEQADKMKCGFLTSADLRQVLQASGHSDIVEAIGSCFARHLKHAGESYLDYNALFDSVRLRREALLEEEIWQAFVKHATDQEISTDREFHRSDLETFFEAFDLSKVCGREGAQDGIRSLWEGGVKYKEWREIFQSTEDFGSFMKELLQQLRSSVNQSLANAPNKE